LVVFVGMSVAPSFVCYGFLLACACLCDYINQQRSP
jgi:hypothetical protein